MNFRKIEPLQLARRSGREAIWIKTGIEKSAPILIWKMFAQPRAVAVYNSAEWCFSCYRLLRIRTRKNMKLADPPKKKKISAVSIRAGDDLLRAIKRKMIREKGKIDEPALRRRGYSNILIERLKTV